MFLKIEIKKHIREEFEIAFLESKRYFAKRNFYQVILGNVKNDNKKT